MSTWLQIGLQDAGSPLMRELVYFHDFAMLIMLSILFFVGYVMLASAFNPWLDQSLTEHQNLETLWTILPAGILIFLAFPSLILLYLHDSKLDCALHVKVLGFQWYWSYEYSLEWSAAEPVVFDSYMLPTSAESSDFLFSRLDVDNRVTLPSNVPIRFLVSSGDVLHSWALPSLGLKADATPGRLNQLITCVERPGLFFGQCSEICGANHSFMPIVIEAISPEDFSRTWA